jgi:ABC-type glucose/galactose transport system permease subunit
VFVCVCGASMSDTPLHGNSPITTTSSLSRANFCGATNTSVEMTSKRLHKVNVYEQIANHFQWSRLWYRDKFAHQLFTTPLIGESASHLQYLIRVSCDTQAEQVSKGSGV